MGVICVVPAALSPPGGGQSYQSRRPAPDGQLPHLWIPRSVVSREGGTMGPRRSRARIRARHAAAMVALICACTATGVSYGAAGARGTCSTADAARVSTWAPAIRPAVAYARSRHGDVSFAIRVNARGWGFRSEHVVATASVLKAMLLVAYLDMPSVRRRALTRADAALLAPMIRRSDNTAATIVRDRVGDGRLVALAHAAGMRHFRPAAIWGLSETTASDQARFFLRIDSFVVRRHRRFALGQLASVIPSQRWGIGRLRLPGWSVYFKGGWGTGTGKVDHQVALLVHGCTRVSVAIMTTDDGTHAYGKQTLYGMAARLLRGLPAFPGPTPDPEYRPNV
jgi:hypothetical protein